MPIQVSLDWAAEGSAEHSCDKLNNVSLGGLSFLSPQPLPGASRVSVRFPLLDQQHSLIGKVVWNRKNGRSYEIGLQFDDPDQLYCLRMIEQVCHIEHYRREVSQLEGRTLSSEEAATEWIARFANEFPAFES